VLSWQPLWARRYLQLGGTIPPASESAHISEGTLRAARIKSSRRWLKSCSPSFSSLSSMTALIKRPCRSCLDSALKLSRSSAQLPAIVKNYPLICWASSIVQSQPVLAFRNLRIDRTNSFSTQSMISMLEGSENCISLDIYRRALSRALNLST